MREPLSRRAIGTVARGAACAALLLAGCAYDAATGSRTADSATPSASAAPTPAPMTSTWKTALDAGIAAYDRGDFREAARRLAQVADDPAATLAARVEAHKFHAFALCSNDLRALCRLQFERALALDPSFDLLPAERGHPIWGPEFLRAKSSRGARLSGAVAAG